MGRSITRIATLRRRKAKAVAAGLVVPPPAASQRVIGRRDNHPADDPLAGRAALRMEEVSKAFGISERTIREMVQSGELRSTKVRRIRLVLVDSLRKVFGLTDQSTAA